MNHNVGIRDGVLRCSCYRSPADVWCTGIREYITRPARRDFRAVMQPWDDVVTLVPIARGFSNIEVRFHAVGSPEDPSKIGMFDVHHEQFETLLGTEDGLITAIRGAEDYYRNRPEYDRVREAITRSVLTPGELPAYCSAPQHNLAAHQYMRKCLHESIRANLEEEFLISCTACTIIEHVCPRCLNLRDTSQDVPEIPY